MEFIEGSCYPGSLIGLFKLCIVYSNSDIFYKDFVTFISIISLQLDAALTIDSLTTMAKGLNTMIDRDPNVLGAVFRRGQFYNNNERGIDCKSPNLSPWQYGQKVLENFRAVINTNYSVDDFSIR